MSTADRLRQMMHGGGGGKTKPLAVKIGETEIKQKRRERLQVFVCRALDEIKAARLRDRQTLRHNDGETQPVDEVRQ